MSEKLEVSLLGFYFLKNMPGTFNIAVKREEKAFECIRAVLYVYPLKEMFKGKFSDRHKNIDEAIFDLLTSEKLYIQIQDRKTTLITDTDSFELSFVSMNDPKK